MNLPLPASAPFRLRPAGRLSGLAAAGAALMLLAGCQTNPATGERQFTAFMSPAQEQQTGDEEHPKILEEFGGAYGDKKVTGWVQEVGERVASFGDKPDLHYTFTVLDTPVINAFALPGGYVYITRGLLALANDEAEVAGVLGHEVGHIAARHTAERYSQSVVANLGVTAAAVLTGSDQLAGVLGQGAQLALLSYSRDQEYQADQLGIRYLGRTGYDPEAMSNFLRQLQRNEQLDAKLAGQSARDNTQDFFATHPNTGDRVTRADSLAQQTRGNGLARGRDSYMAMVDGLLYGDSAEQGYVRGHAFIHVPLGFRFEVPAGFNISNSASKVVATNANGSIIAFDSDSLSKAPGGSMTRYLQEVWAKGSDLQQVETIDINGLTAATGYVRGSLGNKAADIRAVAIRFDSKSIYRFMFITAPGNTASEAEGLKRTTYSFRALTTQEKSSIGPLRIRLVTAKAGDTMTSLAEKMDVPDLKLETFAVLNGLPANAPLVAGQQLKIIREEKS